LGKKFKFSRSLFGRAALDGRSYVDRVAVVLILRLAAPIYRNVFSGRRRVVLFIKSVAVPSCKAKEYRRVYDLVA
jgi:hypothetical protein